MMVSMIGKHIEMFLVDGLPGGLTTAEITNWTGHVLLGRRSDLSRLISREEAGRTGVYFLLGEDATATGSTRCYIGEADDIGDRLRYHHRDKDFWDRVAVITSKDANLTKAHARYLESELIRLAQQAGRVSLENGNAPHGGRLPEAHRSGMDYFISQLQILLPVLGINAIRTRKDPTPSRPPHEDRTASPTFSLVHRKLGVNARAQQIDGEFTMLAGSIVVAQVREDPNHSPSTAKAYASYRSLQEKLVADGSIEITDDNGLVTHDIVFSSPSTAGAIALGRSCNGRTSWIWEGGTFGQWESRGVE